MEKSDFERLDTNFVKYSDARMRLNAAQQQLWGSIISLITDAIVVARTKKDFVSREHIVEYANREVKAYYQSANMKKQLLPGRLTHDGQLVFLVDIENTLVLDAIKWAVICEVIVEVVEGQYALPEPKRA